MKILILGASGMLGSCLYRLLPISNHDIFGVFRSSSFHHFFTPDVQTKSLVCPNYVSDTNALKDLVSREYDVVINCVGLIKHKSSQYNENSYFSINSIFPYKLAIFAQLYGFRLVHFSTDCIFSGNKGFYKESDIPDPQDLYGISKLLGEPPSVNILTLRTSIIGHELSSSFSLVDWYLSSFDYVYGFTKAIFSGLPVVEVANVLMNHVLTNDTLSGLYHLSAQPISKHDLLIKIAKTYGKDPELILPINNPVIDRSLDSSLFQQLTGYTPPCWDKLIEDLFFYYRSFSQYR